MSTVKYQICDFCGEKLPSLVETGGWVVKQTVSRTGTHDNIIYDLCNDCKAEIGRRSEALRKERGEK